MILWFFTWFYFLIMVITWTDLPASHHGAERIPGNTMVAVAAGEKTKKSMHKDIIKWNSAFIFLSKEGEGTVASSENRQELCERKIQRTWNRCFAGRLWARLGQVEQAFPSCRINRKTSGGRGNNRGRLSFSPISFPNILRGVWNVITLYFVCSIMGMWNEIYSCASCPPSPSSLWSVLPSKWNFHPLHWVPAPCTVTFFARLSP